MMKFYSYYLKKRLPILVVLGALFLATIIIVLNQAEIISYERVNEVIIKKVGTFNPFIVLTIILVSCASTIPVMEFAFKMKRRSVDLYYALPLKRSKIYLVKYLVGLTEIFILFLPQWLVTFIWVAASDNLYNLSYFFGYLGVAILGGVLLYTFMCFFFTMANSIIDGILFMGMGTCALPLLINVLYEILLRSGTSNRLFYKRFFFIPSPLFNLSYELYALMSKDKAGAEQYSNLLAIILVGFICFLIGVLFFFIHSKKNDAEKVSDESDSIFGYKTMIPFYMVFSFNLVGRIDYLWAVIAVTGYLGYSIYRRSFRIKKVDILSLSLSVIVGVLIAIFL